MGDSGVANISFDEIMAQVVNGNCRSLEDALNVCGFTDFGLEIPVGFGFSVTIYAPYEAMNYCTNEYEKYACSKMMQYGGAIPLSLAWMEFTLAKGLLYFNLEIGLALIIKPDLDGILSSIAHNVDTGDSATGLFGFLQSEQLQVLRQEYGDTNYKEFLKMEEMFGNKVMNDYGLKFVPILWVMMLSYFNNWYYTGALRRGRIF